MGKTPRDSRFQIPLMTRSTDVSTIGQCEGRWWLSNLYEDEEAEASFFALGTALHVTIENTIEGDWNLDTALLHVEAWLERWLDSLIERPIESSSRGVETILDDARRMLTNWFKFVHPDSDKRHPVYDDYEWPPRVEQRFVKSAEDVGTLYPVWGSIDAHFVNPRGEFGHDLIVDWKSGTSAPGSDHQLDFYRFGAQLPHARAAYHMLDRVQRPSIFLEAGAYSGDDKVRARILKVEQQKLEVLRGNRLPEFNPEWYCDYCPAVDLCPEVAYLDSEPRRARMIEDLAQVVPLTDIGRR